MVIAYLFEISKKITLFAYTNINIGTTYSCSNSYEDSTVIS